MTRERLQNLLDSLQQLIPTLTPAESAQLHWDLMGLAEEADPCRAHWQALALALEGGRLDDAAQVLDAAAELLSEGHPQVMFYRQLLRRAQPEGEE